MTGNSSSADEENGDADRADAASPERVDRLERELRAAGRPFARVTVVRREPPVSANVGDSAVVTPDGELTGWIGGAACAQSVAVKQATAALERNEPVLVGLAPDPDDVARPGLEAYPMTCHSGGTLELFVEPVTSRPRLIVIGESPVARALVRLAGETNFDVTVVAGPDADADSPDRRGADDVVALSDAERVAAAVDGAKAVVVASMGGYDVAGLDHALRGDVPYVGLVASDVRLDELAADVAERLDTAPEAVVDGVTTPAGLDVGAKTPGEIAVSVLAELVAVRRGATGAVALDVADATAVGAGETSDTPEADDHGAHDGHDHVEHDHGPGGHAHGDRDEPEADPETAVDPVCGMDVVVGEAAATVTHDGATYRFCGAGCAEAFEDDPERFVDTGAVTGG